MITFTLDTNCIIDLELGRPAANSVRALADCHANSLADVALVSISASERQVGDYYLESFDDFLGRIEILNLSHLRIIPTIAFHSITYWNQCLYPDEKMTRREALIHEALFPQIPSLWAEFADRVGIARENTGAPEARRWRNALCDSHMFWAHDHFRRDVFVTSDDNFQKRLRRSADFADARIATPDEAVRLL